MSDTKDDIRRRMRQQRRALSPDERRRAGRAIAPKLNDLLADLIDPDAPVAAFMPNDGELPLTTWLEQRLQYERPLLLPRVTDDTLEFAPVSNLDNLQPGRFDIPEPTTASVDITSIAAFLVPGVAFDTRGRRIGMGAGFYDRVLQRHHRQDGRAHRIGIAYDFQLLDSPLPTQPHDIPMTHILTPSHTVSTPHSKT